MKRGASVICEDVRKEIQHMDELEGNYRFCNLEMVRRHLFKHERGHVWTSHAKTHRKLCEAWLVDNRFKIMERLGPDAIINTKIVAGDKKVEIPSDAEPEEPDDEGMAASLSPSLESEEPEIMLEEVH